MTKQTKKSHRPGDVSPGRNGSLREVDIDTLGKVGQYIRGELKLR